MSALLLVDAYILVSLIPNFSKLSRLFLSNVTFGHPCPSNRPQQSPARCANIEQLYISSRADFAPFVLGDLWFLLGTFSHLSTLTFRGMTFSSGMNRGNTFQLAPQRGLKQLTLLDGNEIIVVLRDLELAMEQERLPMLTSLSVGRLRAADMEPLQSVLDALDGQLTSLALQCMSRLNTRT